MSMKVCKDCGTEVSKSAKVCPKCGKKLKHTALRVILGILVIIIGIGALASGGENTTPTSNNQQEKFTLVSDKKVIDSLGTTYIEGEIKNNTNKTYSYVQVTFNLYDANGAQLGTAVDNINNLEPNSTWKYKAIGLVTEKVSTYKFVEITGW
uniref:Zinc-ribbon domain protein n=1 Tax=Myoviridae sp. ctLq07 TaxID=2827681 RepID=A0A8S5TAW6_9CAUD|nr:MAG TPA: zinc-ribbon domain protein [Myoviridae sp. ctLq07]DAY69517.1 MAG TPA: zinc-ribbon domain protein [Caudoviricetes sp.]